MRIQSLCLPFVQLHHGLESFAYLLDTTAEYRFLIFKIEIEIIIHFNRWIAEIYPSSITGYIHENVIANLIVAILKAALFGRRERSDENIIIHSTIESFTQFHRTAQAEIVSQDVIGRAVVQIDPPAMIRCFVHESIVSDQG